ncbi:alpha/beta hydrolase [Bacillus sp. FJAT-27245]|uniref:alpha/beta hydrolase n=1 Tax=Bacillus sp. FJAT-27245 TaxID=1684144 RepID=UPI0006A7B3B0|nr:alpha/beta hydrolase [Bacillus sp. FJAT-27245]
MKTTVVYKTADNLDIKGDFYPVESKMAPVIMYIHGGGLIWGSREDMKEEQIKLYNDAGFAVFTIDYRLAPEAKLPEIKQDVEDAMRWLTSEGAAQFGIDPEKIIVSGGSAGGYLSLLSGTFETKPKAIVSFYGYGDITGSWALEPSPYFQAMARVPKELRAMLVKKDAISVGPITERYGIYLYGRQSGEWIGDVSGVDTLFEKNQLRKWSPFWNVDADYPPTMLLHGTKDDDVPYEESERMSRKLTEAGVRNKLITIRGGAHQFDEKMDDPVVKDAFAEIISFLKSVI